MNKKLIIGGAVGFFVFLLVAAGGFFGYMMFSKLSEYQKLGNLTEIKQLSKEHEEILKKQKETDSKMESLHKEFSVYRAKTVSAAVKRAERKVETISASFTPL